MQTSFQDLQIKYDETFQETIKKLVDYDFKEYFEYIVSIVFINAPRWTKKQSYEFIPDFVNDINCSLIIMNKKSGDDFSRIIINIDEIKSMSEDLINELVYLYVEQDYTLAELGRKFGFSKEKIRYTILKQLDFEI
jgi:DNA-directed RNA polymerase sigma subunit (sigma70/sigma32)